MEKQQTISTARLAKKIGSVQTVLIDEVDEDGAIARSMADAPEIDGAVYIDYTETPLEVGQFVDVSIHASDEYDLWGTLVQ
jgi:ribosomal protein S12 methylthiotransferase